MAIKWTEIEIGKEYLYEETYVFQGRVKVVAKSIDGDYIEYKVRVVSSDDAEAGEEFWTGKNMKHTQFHGMQNFLRLDGKFSYSRGKR